MKFLAVLVLLTIFSTASAQREAMDENPNVIPEGGLIRTPQDKIFQHFAKKWGMLDPKSLPQHPLQNRRNCGNGVFQTQCSKCLDWDKQCGGDCKFLWDYDRCVWDATMARKVNDGKVYCGGARTGKIAVVDSCDQCLKKAGVCGGDCVLKWPGYSRHRDDTNYKCVYNEYYRNLIRPMNGISDFGLDNCPKGWYDVTGQGVANDYCRWVGECGCRGHCSHWSCALAGSKNQYTPKGQINEGDHRGPFEIGAKSDGIIPAQKYIGDLGWDNCPKGWYDVQGQGVANDYCRWVGDCGCRGHCSFFSCALAGLENEYTERGKINEGDYKGPYRSEGMKAVDENLKQIAVGQATIASTSNVLLWGTFILLAGSAGYYFGSKTNKRVNFVDDKAIELM